MALQSHSLDEIGNDLRYINLNLKTKAYDGRSFVPRRALRVYLKKDRVKRLLEITCTNSLNWEEVCTKYLAVFVILLIIDRGPYITHFLQHNHLADAHLPFNNDSIWPSEFRKFFKDFDSIQWEYCAQRLGSDDLHDKVLDPRLIVPIVSQHFLKAGDSRTSKIEVHPDYNCLLPPSQDNTIVATPRFFVLKSCGLRNVNLHNNEVRAYTNLRHHNDILDNIARFYGSWRQGDTYNILLEYVDGGTLEDLFAKDHPATAWDMLSFWTKLLRILNPVCRIHCQGDPKSYDKVDHGVHQDIKPHNILVARSLSSTNFDDTFKLADLGLTYFPLPEANQCQERRGRDVPGTQMYSAPEVYRDEADSFVQRTVRAVDCKKDVWSLGCVLSEASVWCVLGAAGLVNYRSKRKAETARLSNLKSTGYEGCFHDGEEVLSVVRDMHVKVRKSRGVYDQIINDVMPIIDDMLAPVEQRPEALAVRRRFRHALETAQQMCYPEPFQVSPEPSPPPHFPRSHAGATVGLGMTYPPSQHLRTPRDGPNSPESPMLAPSPRLNNGFHETSIDSVVRVEPTSFTPRSIGRSFTDQVRTPPIGSPSLQRASGQALVRDRGINAPEANTRNSVQFAGGRSPAVAATHVDDQSVHDTSSQNQLVTGTHSRDIAKKNSEATTRQVLDWIRRKKLSSFSMPTPPVPDDKIAFLRGTDQIFIIDNSKSMKPYRQQVKEVFEALAYLVKGLDHDGIDLYFTNSSKTGHGHHRDSMIATLSNIGYFGETHMEVTLGKVLERSNNRRWSASLLLKRESKSNWGKSIYVFTDGNWFGEDESLCGIPELVERVTSKMDSRAKLGIQFIQFGSDPVGTWRLKELDEGLQERGILDIIDTERYDGNVVKMLLGHRTNGWD